MNSNQITIAQIVGAFTKHKFKSLLMFLTVLALVCVGFLLWPRKYGSEGKLYVQLSGVSSTSIAPASGSDQVSIQDSRETEVRSVVEFINSRAVLDSVIEEIGQDEILESPWDKYIPEIAFPSVGGSSGADDDGMTKEEFDRLKRRELAAKMLEQSMSVHTEKKTSVISIFIKANSARLAQRLVDSIMKHTMDKYMKVQSIEGSTRYYDEEFDAQVERLEKAQAALRDFRNEHQALSIGGERGTLQGVLSRLENDLLTAEIDLASANRKVEKLTVEMAKVERLVIVPKTGVEMKAFADARTELFKLEGELAKARADFRPGHPKISMLVDQVAQLEKSLGGIRESGTESAAESNPVYGEVNVLLVSAISEKASASARLEDITGKLEQAREDLVELNNAELMADKLQRAVGVQQDYLSIFQRKRGESRALDGYDICQIKPFQNGTLVVKHISPKGSLVAPMGVLLALMCAGAIALYADRNHLSTALGEDEVEQILELPVLVTLPRVYSSRNMVN